MSDRRDIVVTGLGPVTSIGVGEKNFRFAQHAGVRGVRPISRFDASGLPTTIAGEIDLPAELHLPRRDAAVTDRCTHLLGAAAGLALADAGLDVDQVDKERVGVAIGTGLGNMDAWEETISTAFGARGPSGISPRWIPKCMANSGAAWLSMNYGFTGPTVTTALACASGGDALIAGFQMIASGEADVVLAGGSDAPITRSAVGGFSSMRALSRRNDDPPSASRPFSIDRDGFVLAEGAGVLVLESTDHARARGARTYARFAGYGRTSDAHHVTAPRPDGGGARRAMLKAVDHAGLAPDDIGYINAHGTGTVLNDITEAKAIVGAFSGRASSPAVSSTKSLTGHTMGASGSIEAIATVQAIAFQVVPPTANLVPDPAILLDLAASARRLTIAAALSSSLAFGGHNVVLAFTSP